MSTLIVTYDLNKETTRPKIVEAIRKYGSARLSESSYAISTDETPATVYAKLSKFIDANDFIYIINLKKPYCGFGPSEVNQWLEDKLPF